MYQCLNAPTSGTYPGLINVKGREINERARRDMMSHSYVRSGKWAKGCVLNWCRSDNLSKEEIRDVKPPMFCFELYT
jgi:hypothetical protein